MGERVFLVGPGRAGLSLAYALWRVEAAEAITVAGRRPDPPAHPLFIQGWARYVFGLERPGPQTTVLILAVPDEALQEVAAGIAALGAAPAGCVAFHLSGAKGADPLAPLLEAGYEIGTLHPLQTLADPILGAEQLEGSYFAVSGGAAAISGARRILHHLGARVITIPVTRRPLYHAAAVLASNYLTVLLGASARLMAQAGVPEDEALDAILPLARGSLENLGRLGPAQALTGPIRRGDLETVRLHLKTLGPRERSLYVVLGLEALDLAREMGLAEETATTLHELLEGEQ
jgi:predicted short-subunit dehydrogenase-like oxidoreductase (DUF2520 family)